MALSFASRESLSLSAQRLVIGLGSKKQEITHFNLGILNRNELLFSN